MNPDNTLAIVLYEGGDKALKKFCASSFEENDLVPKHETTHLEPKNYLSDNDAIHATPMSYCLPQSTPDEEKEKGTMEIEDVIAMRRKETEENRDYVEWFLADARYKLQRSDPYLSEGGDKALEKFDASSSEENDSVMMLFMQPRRLIVYQILHSSKRSSIVIEKQKLGVAL